MLMAILQREPNTTVTDSESFNFKANIIERTTAGDNIKDFKIAVPWKFFINFRRTLEMSLISCKIDLILTWSSNCDITDSISMGTSSITDINPYFTVVTLSIQDNGKLLEQFKSVVQKYQRKYKNNI